MTAWKARHDLFKPEDFGKAARFEAEDMKEKLNAALHNRKYV
jgi:orotidine-5'-phosphate decarboxylase